MVRLIGSGASLGRSSSSKLICILPLPGTVLFSLTGSAVIPERAWAAPSHSAHCTCSGACVEQRVGYPPSRSRGGDTSGYRGR